MKIKMPPTKTITPHLKNNKAAAAVAAVAKRNKNIYSVHKLFGNEELFCIKRLIKKHRELENLKMIKKSYFLLS